MREDLTLLIARTMSAIPFNRKLGLRLESIDDNHVIMNFDMNDELIGNFLYGILHGGVVSSVLDMAGGVATMAHAVSKHPEKSIDELAEILGKTSTVDLNINYLRPGKGEKFHAKASLVKAGKKISFARMELYNDQEILIATGSATYLVSG